MCGVTGFLDTRSALTADTVHARLVAMTGALAHRGPDADGYWCDPASGIALGHRRLSIVDLSDAGAQPMRSASERFVISYNGELYNADDLSGELRASGRTLRGHCDTEVLVEAIDAWGLERTLAKSNGMFAFALWDRRERRLHLVRDRLGEKPLYYGWAGSTLLFASELKALRAHPEFDPEIDRDALALYFRFDCFPAPYSIYRHVRKVPPGAVLTIDPSEHAQHARPVPYWSAVDAFEAGPRDLTDEDAVDAVNELLLDAIRIRMRSDVPLGAFLSGGLDSSVIVALMQAQSDTSVRTFTIGSPNRTYNEADRAAQIASRLGTRHSELMVTAADALAVVPRLGSIYDEPFADSSQIPTLLVAELARRDVTVSLSGDGGDEIFGGYDRYRTVPSLSRRLAGVPPWARAATARAMLAVPPRAWDVATAPIPARYRPRIPATKVAKLAQLLTLDESSAMFGQLVSHWDDPAALVIDGCEPDVPRGLPPWDEHGDLVEQMMMRDTVGFLPDDILVKLDRATMSVSLEGRIPLLDHRVVELLASMPSRMKVRDGETKFLLRRVLDRYLPPALSRSPKSGFGIPVGSWLRGPLREWASDLLSPHRIRRDGYLRERPIRDMWDEHQSKRRDWGYHLWDVLMFQSWLDTWERV
jgi:asparagine synthase (glutamine-hydrolysing)